MAELNMKYSQNAAAAPRKSFDTKSNQLSLTQRSELRQSSNLRLQESEPSLLYEQVIEQARQYRKLDRRDEVDRGKSMSQQLLDVELPDYSDLILSLPLQHQARLVDEDPQLTEMYWYNLGHHQSDAEALRSCQW